MSEFNKYSTDGGATFIDVEDSNAVHWGDQSKGYVGKNLFRYNTSSSSTSTGVSFSINIDKSVSLSGTSTGATVKDLAILKGSQLKALGSDLILSGGNENAYLAIRTSTWTFIARSYGGDIAFNTSSLEDNTDYYISIGVGQAGINTNGIVIYPMLRFASILDSTYEPPLTPNTDLMSYADNNILGAKNILPFKLLSMTSNDVTCEYDNSIGAYHLSGTNSSENPTGFAITSKIGSLEDYHTAIFKAGETYIASVGLQNNGVDPFSIRVRHTDGTYKNYGVGRITFTQDVGVIFVQVSGGATIDTDIYPMLRLASDNDDTYVPHVMTNKMLMDKIPVIEDIEITLTNESHKFTTFSKGTILSVCFVYNEDFYYSTHANEEPLIAIGEDRVFIDCDTNVNRTFKVRVAYIPS